MVRYSDLLWFEFGDFFSIINNKHKIRDVEQGDSLRLSLLFLSKHPKLD